MLVIFATANLIIAIAVTIDSKRRKVIPQDPEANCTFYLWAGRLPRDGGLPRSSFEAKDMHKGVGVGIELLIQLSPRPTPFSGREDDASPNNFVKSIFEHC